MYLFHIDNHVKVAQGYIGYTQDGNVLKLDLLNFTTALSIDKYVKNQQCKDDITVMYILLFPSILISSSIKFNLNLPNDINFYLILIRF